MGFGLWSAERNLRELIARDGLSLRFSSTGSGPVRHLSQPTGTATVQTAYDTTELPTQVGEVLEVVHQDL